LPCRGHVFLHLVSSDCALNDKNEGNSLRYGPNCCLQVEAIIQTLENDIKTSTEIIKILSEEWRNCCAKEEVRSDKGHYMREDFVGDSPSSNCKNIKTQFCEVQKEYSSLTTRTNILKEDLKHIRQTSNFKLSHKFSNKRENQGNSPVPPTNTDDNYYTVPTNNRFTILSNYPDPKSYEAAYTWSHDNSSRPRPTNNKQQYRNYKQKKPTRRDTPVSWTNYNQDNYNQQGKEMNEESVNYIPTIVNGITNITTIQEQTQKTV